jgi:acyl transferase domain-containing protein/phosphopantetheinyl transferase
MPAAIVGMACVLPGAPDLDAFWTNIAGGVDAITEVPANRWDPVFYDPAAGGPDRFYCRRGGFVDGVADFDPAAFGIMPLAVDGAEPDQLLALAVAARALADAGDPHRRVEPNRTGVIVGRGGYIGSGVRRLEQRVHTAEQLVVSLRALLPDLGESQLTAVKAEFVERLGPDRPESAIDLVPNLTASRISNRLDLRGPSHTVDAACASSLIAVDQAIDQLSSGRCDVVLAGGVHHCHDLTLWSVFTQLGAISRRQEIRAFDRRADGLLIGEGTVMLVLKRLADAEADGDRVYAVVRGTGVASDGRATSLMSPSVDGQILAVEQAWQRAGLDPTRIGLLEAHGTGTPTGDAVELQTLRRVFGSADGARAGLGSVKSMIGHAMPAAGAAGIVKAALAIWHGQLAPTLHADDPSPLVAETRFRLVQESEPWPSGAARVAGVDAFGFGGINAHVVLEEHLASTGRSAARRRPAPVLAGTARHRLEAVPEATPEAVLTVSGADPAAVAEHLARIITSGLGVAPSADLEGTAGPCRLAIVAPTPKRLALAASVVQRGRPFAGRNDVWFQPSPLIGEDRGPGRLAFLFPGLEPDFAPHLDDVASLMGYDAHRIVAETSRIEVLGPAVIDTGRLLYGALETMGARPDLVAGHSVGEWTAQIVTGMTPGDALEPLLDQLQPGRIGHPDVAFLALGCSVETAAELLGGLPDIVVSHDNCPHQSVVCGADGAIAEVEVRARQGQILAQQLPFRSGFHTPMFAPFLEGMRQLFGSLPVHRPSVPVWSATTAAPYPDDAEGVRALTIDHLTRPVGWRRLINRLHEHGERVFVEVGAGSLSGFVDDTLGDLPHLAVAAHSPKRHGLAQLRRAGAALWCAGADVHLDALDCLVDRAAVADARPAGATPPGRPLRFGNLLVRDLSPLARPRFEQPAATLGAATAPVAIAFQATMDHAAVTSRQVFEQWDQRRVSAAAPMARPVLRAITTPPPAAPTPTGARVAPAGGGNGTGAQGDLVRDQRFSLAAEPAWADHAIFSQRDGWPDQSDRFPIVPLTAMIDRFIELAAELRPDLVPVGLEDVRAMRWLVVEPATTTTVRATMVSTDAAGIVRIRTAIDGHARATVLMADRFADPPILPPSSGRSRPLPYPVAAIYAGRWLFHGPAYQGIRAITGWDETGIEGEVTALRAPGALLDNAGQVLGLWVALALDERRTVLPTTIDRITFYRPRPAVGRRVRCQAEVTAIEKDRVVADLSLADADGVWARIEGWVERRFDTTNPVFEVIRSPQDHVIAQITRHGWAWADETWLDPASREMIMRRYLNTAEREAYGRRNPRAQRASLVGRVALKDLLRHQQWRMGAGPIFPAEVTITNDEAGRPCASGVVESGVKVSIAHSHGVGVAMSDRRADVGIDIERLGKRTPHFADAVLAERERVLLEEMAGSIDDRLTTIWAVKEAAAKAAGTGLAGRSKAWEIAERIDDRYRIGERWLATEHLSIPWAEQSDQETDHQKTDQNNREREYVVAWTLPHP